LDIPGSSLKALKAFRCAFGIISRLPFPYHTKKVARTAADKHQFLFAPKSYDVKCVEFTPTDPDDIVIRRNEEVADANAPAASKRSQRNIVKKASRNDLRLRKAHAIITRFSDLPRRRLSEGPAMFVPRVHRDPPKSK
jgi:hypothetical protein